LIETPEHEKNLHQLSVEEIILIFKAIQKRIKKLSERQKIDYILTVKVYGPLRGSLEHPHMHIITYPKIPKEINEEIKGFNNYWKVNKKCIFCDIIEKENKSSRKVIENKDFFVLAPFASRNPYEVWILPKSHIKNVIDLDDEKLFSFAEILKDSITRLDKLLPNLSYELVVHERPASLKMQDFHFHVEIYPILSSRHRGRKLGIMPNSVSPEKAASELKK
jgi:UDPglucose--hexose-1-phosphate uridylyltransferase